MKLSNCKYSGLPFRQRGAITMFSAVLILILLTEVILYATQVGVFEQRKSGNDLRQKQAFHAAEAGVQHAKEFFLANALRLSYAGPGGWLEPGSERWQLCPDDPDASHPCSGEALRDVPAVFDNTFFYSPTDEDLQVAEDPNLLPLNRELLDLEGLGQRSDVWALLCILDINRAASPAPVVQGCTTTPPENEHIYFMLTILARGQADCQDAGDFDDPDCAAEVLIAEKVGSFGPAAGDGGPGVPLTTRSSFPPGGTAEIVPNPNGGGIGVPLSAWINGRPAGSLCPGQESPVDPKGASWSTCEAHEWYGVATPPDKSSPNGAYACPEANCSCGAGERQLSYSELGEQTIGIDIVADETFPCDLFRSITGREGTPENFWDLAGSMGQIIDSCDQLGPDSAGVYWMIGSDCTLNGSSVIGSAEFPVFLISAADVTKMSGGGSLFGIVFVTDVLGNSPKFESIGGWTTYGAVIVEGDLDKYTGTFQIVYVDSIVRLASNSGGVGEVTGGWTDAHPFWRF